VVIEEALAIGLPRAYTPELYQQKCEATMKSAAIPPSARSRWPRPYNRAKSPAGAGAGAAGALRMWGRRGYLERCREERVGSDA